YNCKHVVAVLLASLEQTGGAPEALGTVLPASAEFWLQQLVETHEAVRSSATPTSGQAYRLDYVLMPGPGNGRLRLHLCKSRLRKDGSVGASAIYNDFYGLLLSKAALVQRGDEDLIRQLAGLRVGNIYNDDIEPVGRVGESLLAQLCVEGRLMLAETRADLKRGHLFPVRRGPLRHAKLGWHADATDGESVRLRWRFDDGTALDHVLATEPACYLAGDMLGELALPAALAALPPVTLLNLVEKAPPLRPEQCAGMAARLVEQGMDRIIPVPQGLQARQRSDIAPTAHLLLDSFVTVVRGELQWHDYALPYFDYDGISTEGINETVLRRVAGDAVELIERDTHAEGAAAATLAELGFVAPPGDSALAELPDALQLPTQAAWLAFARHDLPRLRAAGWQIEIEGDYRYDVVEAQEWYAELNEDGEGAHAWFALELGILVDGRRHALLPLLLEMIRNAPEDFAVAALAKRDDSSDIIVALPDTTRVVLPWIRVKPILATLGELYLGDRIGSALRLPVTDAARLAELEQTAQLRWMGGERLRELGRKLSQFDGIRQVDVPIGLQARLRPYQQAGLSWMQFLREYG
ncbi:MAG TPA: helicase, partial [Telluria sp.]